MWRGATTGEPDTTFPATTAAAEATTTPAARAAAICAILEGVKARDAEISAAMAEATEDWERLAASGEDWRETQLQDLKTVYGDAAARLPETVDSYSRAAAVADPDMASDLEIVRDNSVALATALEDAFRQADTLEEAQSNLTRSFAEPALVELTNVAAEALTRLDSFTTAECGFRLSS